MHHSSDIKEQTYYDALFGFDNSDFKKASLINRGILLVNHSSKEFQCIDGMSFYDNAFLIYNSTRRKKLTK